MDSRRADQPVAHLGGSRWGSGGDYMGLAADKAGVFHPFWADARSGTFQIYTADVRVEVPKAPEPGKKTARRRRAGQARPRGSDRLTESVELIFDPTRYDEAKKQIEIPVRIRNKSSPRPSTPPIRLEVLGFGFPRVRERGRQEAKRRERSDGAEPLQREAERRRDVRVSDQALAGTERAATRRADRIPSSSASSSSIRR